MRIGIDFTAAAQPAGIGRYTWSLVSALIAQPFVDQITLLMPRFSEGHWRRLVSPKLRYRYLPLSERALTRIWHRLRIPLYADLLAGGVDVFYAPDFVLPPLWRAPGVITVHDLSYLHFPDSYPNSLRSYLESVVPRSVARAQLVLADSEATRQDLIGAYHVEPARIEVLHCGIDGVFHSRNDPAQRAAVLQRHGIAYPYFLTVGTIQPRKNIARVIAAMRSVVEAGLPHHLVHVGRPGWLYEQILAAPQEHGVSERVHFLTTVDSDEDLAVLYSSASALVFPSLYEGFGLPVLEAMACGTPVVTSNTSSLPEVSGEAAILVDPNDVDAIGGALLVLATNEVKRAQLIAAGRERAAGFTWERSASELRAHLVRVVSGG